MVYSEMASVSALFFYPVKSPRSGDAKGVFNRVKPSKTLDLVRFSKNERPYVVQLFGKNPEHFAKATEIISKKVKPDGIDINFGCPAKKVFGNGSGCALMPQKELAREIIKAVCENTNLPVSLKIRTGIKGHTAIDFIKDIQDLPFSAVMVHGRTYEGSFHGEVDFKIVEKIKKLIPDKIILGNGGINTPEDAVKILKKYPLLDGLGIARGAWGRPYIFAQIKDLLKSEKYTEYDLKKIKKVLIRHAQLIRKDKKELGMFEIRKHLAWYVKGFPGAAGLRRRLVQAKSVEEIKEILSKI